LLGLFARKAAFLRTPKTTGKVKWWEPLRANWAESALALAGLAGICASLTRPTQISGPLLAALLVFPTLGLAAAPVNSWAARRATLPAPLRERRLTEYRRDRRSFAAGAAVGGLVTMAAVVTAAVALLLVPGHHGLRSPTLTGPVPGHHGHTHSPHPSVKPSPSISPTSPSPSQVPSSPAPSPSPSPTPSSPGSPTSPATSPAPTSPAASPSPGARSSGG